LFGLKGGGENRNTNMFVFILNVVKGERTLVIEVTELTKQKNDKGSKK